MIEPTESEFQSFFQQMHCHICYASLSSYWFVSWRCTRNSCNLNYKVPNCIPIVFHNMSGYDIHLFIKETWASKNEKDKLDVIPITNENYISVSYKICMNDSNKKNISYLELRFINSFRFLPSSLE